MLREVFYYLAANSEEALKSNSPSQLTTLAGNDVLK